MRALSHVVVVSGIVALTSPALAADDACRAAVEAAFSKQRQTKGFRFAARVPGEAGETRMTIDYQLPDRMHQKVEAPGHPAPVETIAIARWAWGTMGGGWEELQPQFAQSVTAHVHETLAAPLAITAEFDCLGKVVFDGAEYLGYRAAQPSSFAAAGGAATPAGGEAPPLARTLYVDAATGLPMRNVVARADGAGAPVFDGRYTYPDDIAIEAPIGGRDIPPKQ